MYRDLERDHAADKSIKTRPLPILPAEYLLYGTLLMETQNGQYW